VFAVASLAAPAARAQDDTDPTVGQTIVTARKVDEPATSVPQSVSVVDESVIEGAGLDGVREAALRVPNVHVTEFTSRRLSFPYVRGIGSGQGEPAVTTYLDGVPQLTTGSTNLPLFEVQRIEFLRGPQGTLYGRNALGGVLHVISKPPSMEPESWLDLSFGEFDFQQLRFSTSGPLEFDRMAFRFGGMYSRREGFTENDFTGEDVDSRDAWYGRGELLYRPDDESELRVSLTGETAHDGAFALAPLESLRDRPHHLANDYDGSVSRDLVMPAVTWIRRGDDADFTSITAIEDWSVLEKSDFDFSTLDGVRRRTEEDQQYVYQELRLSSSEEAAPTVGDDWRLRWVAGFSGFVADSMRSAENDLRPGGVGILFPVAGLDTNEGDFDDWGGALFANTSVRREKLELGVGLRYDHEDKSADLAHQFETGGILVRDDRESADESFDEIVPQALAAWHFDDDTMMYASAAQGFKAGGFNLAAPTGRIAFDPETSTTLELGAKKSWPTAGIDLAFALFWIDWSDMQLSLFDATVGGFVDNAGESTSQGFEIEALAEPVEGLQLSAAFGYVDTEFDEYVDPYGVDVSGNSLTFAPETTLALGAQYSWEVRRGLEPFVRVDWMDVGEFFYDPQNLESESYQLVDLRVGFRAEAVTLSVWAKNLFDEEYVPVAFQASPADPSVFVGESGAPQMVGVTLRFAF
jgi:iron complex outermembrane receptor protein